MTDQDAGPHTTALDALIAQLLSCGGALSQIVAHMQEFEASGLSSPDAPPVLEVAHSLIRSVIGDLTKRHSDDEIRVAAQIVEEVTTAMCEEIFFVPPSEIHRARNGSGAVNPRGRRGRRRRTRSG